MASSRPRPGRDHPGEPQLAAWRGLLAVHRRLVAVLDAELKARHDLPLDWYDVLVQLHEAGGSSTMGELARALLISAPNSTRLVDRMQRAGLVHRSVDPCDARVRHATLTAAGRSTLRRAAPTHLAGIQAHFARFVDDDQAAELTELFTAMAATTHPAADPTRD